MDFKQFRKDRKLTQKQAGALIGVSDSTWCRLELGRPVPEAYRMAAVSLIEKASAAVAVVDPVVVELPENTQSGPVAFDRSALRTQQINGAPWFALVDVCAAVDYKDPHKAVDLIAEDNRAILPGVDSLGRTKELWFISESGLYQLLLRCRLPKAEPFSDWVTAEVLPTLRQTGSYKTAPGPDLSDLARLVGIRTTEIENLIVEQRQQLQQVREQVEQQAAAVDQQIADKLQAAELERRIVADMRGHIRKSVNFLVSQTKVPHRTFYAAMHFYLHTGKLDDIQGRDQAEKALAWLRAQAAERGVILPGYQQPMDLKGVAQ